VTQRNHDRAYLANLGDDHFTGIGEVVGVTDMEYFAMTFRIADGSDVFRARCPIDAGLASAAGQVCVALASSFSVCWSEARIVVNMSYRTNIAKVIKRLKNNGFQSRCLHNHHHGMFCKEM
jgi:hypothetical protein